MIILLILQKKVYGLLINSHGMNVSKSSSWIPQLFSISYIIMCKFLFSHKHHLNPREISTQTAILLLIQMYLITKEVFLKNKAVSPQKIARFSAIYTFIKSWRKYGSKSPLIVTINISWWILWWKSSGNWRPNKKSYFCISLQFPDL